jgi:hypothetical protein
VPAALGGVLWGRAAIVDQLRQTAGVSRFEVKQMFGDDEHVCLVGKVSAERFLGSQYLRGADLPYSTYECIVYRIANGKLAESTAYINWLDPYVQLGLVEASTLTRWPDPALDAGRAALAYGAAPANTERENRMTGQRRFERAAIGIPGG